MDSIPVINIGEGEPEPGGLGRCSETLFTAFRTFGFVALAGHGVDAGIAQEAYRVSKEFFALPDLEKRKYLVPNGAGARGYTPFGTENAKGQSVADLKEFWHVGREPTHGCSCRSAYPPNVWPAEVQSFQIAMLQLYEALDGLGRRVLHSIAGGLGLSPDYFEDKVQYGNSILRPLHYPPIGADVDGAVRAAAHEDINLITLLVGSEEPGLQVLSKGGRWLEAPTGEDLIICNIGDMLQRLSNHVLPSTTHRVVNPPAFAFDRSRFSIPFFLHPNSDFLIETLPQCISKDRPNRYPVPISADDYLVERLREIGLL